MSAITFDDHVSQRGADCVVFERRPRWGPLLRREIGDCVREIRSVEECLATLCETPSSIFVLQESPRNRDKLLEFVIHGMLHSPPARFIVVSGSRDRNGNSSWIECGACYVANSIRSFEQVAGVVRRHIDRNVRHTHRTPKSE